MRYRMNYYINGTHVPAGTYLTDDVWTWDFLIHMVNQNPDAIFFLTQEITDISDEEWVGVSH